MATFAEIVAESEKTRHKVYFLQDENGKKYRAPKPKRVSPIEKLKRMREQERKQRAVEMARLYDGSEVDLCSLLDKPKHITQADGSLPLMLCLIRKVMAE